MFDFVCLVVFSMVVARACTQRMYSASGVRDEYRGLVRGWREANAGRRVGPKINALGEKQTSGRVNAK
jgi:hypothetical protein